ncbi:MAG: O-antigen ligase family protein [Sedimentisphaerales bacterium]|nr:O-antigen ligase family protein [Sedimentisphaerales bacterium]
MPKVNRINFTDYTPTNKLDIAIECLLVSLLVFMPLVFGVVHAWSKEVVIIISGAIVICFLLKFLIFDNQRIIWTWAYVPLVLFLILIIFQLIPIPAWIVGSISPNTAELKRELLDDLKYTDAALNTMTISFYPHATKHDLRLVLALAGVFVVVLNVFHRPEQIKRLLRTIALIGALIAFIALAQNLFGNNKIYWFISKKYYKGYSGPFVNRSHYGQFINLSIGATLGFVMVKLHEVFHNKKVTLPTVFEYFCSNSAIWLWPFLAFVGAGTATIFISLTRGGMISMLIAMGFTTLLISSKRQLRSNGWTMVTIALIAFTCILYIGFDAVYNRLATLRDLHDAGAVRLQMLKDTTTAWSKFPLLGTGLGTYSVVYPMFDHSTITALATHAENEYAQVSEETGLIGLILLIIFAAIIGFHFFRNIRRSGQPVCSAAYGLGFGLMAILIHSFCDFGQHLPANAYLSIMFCALLITSSRQEKTEKCNTKKIPIHGIKVIKTALLPGALCVWMWMIIGANNSRLAEAEWNKVESIAKNLAEEDWQGTNAVYSDLLSHASAASKYEPENVRYIYWLNVYRWRSINQTANPNIADAKIAKNSMPVVRDIVSQLNIARMHCPTYGPFYSFVGQIEKFLLNDEAGAEKIEKGYLLAPCDPIVCFVAGYLDILEGRYEQCFAKFEKAVQLDGGLFNDVVSIYVDYLSCPRKAITLAGDDLGRLSHVALVLTEGQYEDLAQQCREKIKNLLEQMCSSPDAPAPALASLANIYKEQHNNEAAIECYRRALILDYGQVRWRIELTKLLAEMKMMPEAMHEARICLRLLPDSREAQMLVADFSVNPATWNKDSLQQ